MAKKTSGSKSSGTVNGKRKKTRYTAKKRQRMKNPRRDDMPKVSKQVEQEASDAIKSVSDQMVEAIADMTVKPLKKLLTPNAIGGAVAVATRSPLAGFITAGGLNAAGGAVNGLGKLGQSIQELMQLQAGKQSIEAGVKKDNDDLWLALIKLVDQNDASLAEQKLRRAKEEKMAFKQLERERELTIAEKQRMQLLEELTATMKDLKGNKEKPKNMLQKSLDWLLSTILHVLGFNYIAGKISPRTKLMKGILGKGGIVALIAGGIKTIITTLTKGMGLMITGGLKLINPIAIVLGIYNAVKSGIEGWLKYGNIEGVIAGALGGLVELITFGIVDSKDATAFIYKAVDMITSGLGQLFATVYTAIAESAKSIVNYDYTGMVAKLVDSVSMWLVEGFNKQLSDWASILEQLGVNTWFQGVVDRVKTAISDIGDKLISLMNTIVGAIVNIVNKIPFVEIGADGDHRRAVQNNNELVRELEKKKKDIELRKVRSGFFSPYSEEQKATDLVEVEKLLTSARAEQSSLTGNPTTVLNTAERINSPASKQAISTAGALLENNRLKADALMTKPVVVPPAPQSNMAVSNNSSTNFIGPVSKRNNENSFVRSQDRNNPNGMR